MDPRPPRAVSVRGSDLTGPLGVQGCSHGGLSSSPPPLSATRSSCSLPPYLRQVSAAREHPQRGLSRAPMSPGLLLSPMSPVFCLHSSYHSLWVDCPCIWGFARRTHSTHHVVVPMAKTYNSDIVRIHTWITREKTQAESGGSCVWASSCSLPPMRVTENHSLLAAKTQQYVCNVSAQGSPLQTRRPRLLLGADDMCTLCLASIKIPDLQEESRCINRIVCTNRGGSGSHP